MSTQVQRAFSTEFKERIVLRLEAGERLESLFDRILVAVGLMSKNSRSSPNCCVAEKRSPLLKHLYFRGMVVMPVDRGRRGIPRHEEAIPYIAVHSRSAWKLTRKRTLADPGVMSCRWAGRLDHRF